MKFYLVDYMEERNMSKALETVGAVHTHTHTHKTFFNWRKRKRLQ